MNRFTFLTLTISLLCFSCKPGVEEHFLVRSGEPSELLDPGEDWTPEDGYIESKGEYFLAAEKCISSGAFQMSIKMEIESPECFMTIMAGDNKFGFDGLWDEIPAGIVLEGPSFHLTHQLKMDPGEVIPLGKPFNILVKYENKLLEYSIDGKEIFSEEVVNEPFGRIRIEGWGDGKYIRIYDWSISGELLAPGEIYTRERLLARAQKSVDLRAEEVKNDPNRPIYHLQPPANWNNDPNGTLYYNGYYHMFYQHNPFADYWNWMHWGHMRSKDLVTWEHLPIALWPSLEKGEEHCFSGSAIVNRKGEPMLFYTSIGHDAPEQWVAIPVDDELITWEKHPANPILHIDDHKGEVIEDWRDPQLIHEGEQTLMVVGGHPDDKGGSIMLYKALNDYLTEWDYLGVAFSGEEGNWECPNFFRIGDKWVVIYSPHGQVMYYTGNFDLNSYKFTPEKKGSVDFGFNYYAPNSMEDGKGRRLLWGWITDFKKDQGWQGAITVPRNLSISKEGWLIQAPVEELLELRGEQVKMEPFTLKDETRKIKVPGHEFELLAECSRLSAGSYGIRVNREQKCEIFEISVDGDLIHFGEREISLEPFRLGDDLSLRLFFDRTVVELYVNGGLVCATAVVYPDKENPAWELFVRGGELEVKSLDIWKMTSIYK